jgi:hypothetical protein
MTLYMCFTLLKKASMTEDGVIMYTRGRIYEIAIKGSKLILSDDSGNSSEILHFYTDCNSVVMIFDKSPPQWVICDEVTTSEGS